VQPGQHLAPPHAVPLLDQDGDNPLTVVECQLHLAQVHVTVEGEFLRPVPAVGEPPPQAPGRAGSTEHQYEPHPSSHASPVPPHEVIPHAGGANTSPKGQRARGKPSPQVIPGDALIGRNENAFLFGYSLTSPDRGAYTNPLNVFLSPYIGEPAMVLGPSAV